MSDTLTAASIASALTPPHGMRPIPLASQSYELASVAASSERLLNFVAEKMPPGSRSAFILKPTAGIEAFTVMGTGPLRASATLAGSMWAISGSHAWRMQDDGSPPTDLGDVGTADADHAVSIAVGLTGVVFCVPPNAYVTDLAGAAVQQITTGTGNFPAEGASSVCYIDGYYVFSSFTGTYFFLSKLLDATSFDSLDYVRISSAVDYILRCSAHNGELWLHCLSTVQVWYDTGAVDGPFNPRAGGIIPHGLGAPSTLVELDGSMFWLGVESVVFRSNGYQAIRISDHALEEILANYDNGFLRTAYACGFVFQGHSFYALSLPVVGRTFVYDCESARWTERSSSVDGTGRWNINTACLLGARLVLGDSATGNLYHMKASFADENGVVVRREAVLPMLLAHGPRQFMNRLEIEMEVGVAPPDIITLDWSDDGGINYKAPRTIGAGSPGATRTRVVATRLGSFRQRVLRIRSSGAATIYGADVDVSPNTTASA